MNNIKFKVVPRGEGKTKWLLDVANSYAHTNKKVYLYTADEMDYAKFCEKYFKKFGHVCCVERLTAFKLTENDIVLVDDLLSHDTSVSDFTYIHNNCEQMYVTLDGELATEIIPTDFEQLSIDFSNVRGA